VFPHLFAESSFDGLACSRRLGAAKWSTQLSVNWGLRLHDEVPRCWCSNACYCAVAWCRSQLETWNFRSALFLVTLGWPLPFIPRPRRFSSRGPSGIFGPSSTPFSHVTLGFRWVDWTCWTPRWWAGGLACPDRSDTFLRRCAQSAAGPYDCKGKAHPLRYVETKSFSQFSLLPDSCGFLRGTGPSPYRPLWTTTVTAFFVLLPMM